MRIRWLVPLGLVVLVIPGVPGLPDRRVAEFSWIPPPKRVATIKPVTMVIVVGPGIPIRPIIPEAEFDFDDYSNRHGYDDAYDKSDYSGK